MSDSIENNFTEIDFPFLEKVHREYSENLSEYISKYYSCDFSLNIRKIEVRKKSDVMNELNSAGYFALIDLYFENRSNKLKDAKFFYSISDSISLLLYEVFVGGKGKYELKNYKLGYTEIALLEAYTVHSNGILRGSWSESLCPVIGTTFSSIEEFSIYSFEFQELIEVQFECVVNGNKGRSCILYPIESYIQMKRISDGDKISKQTKSPIKNINPEASPDFKDSENSIIKYFSYLYESEPEIIFSLIQNEHPQTIAFIISQLPKHLSKKILNLFSGDKKNEIDVRIIDISIPKGHIAREIERIFERKSMSDEYITYGEKEI